MKLTIGRLGNNMHYISVPETVVKKYGSKRVICTLNSEVSQHSSFIFSKDVGYYVYINKTVMKQLSLKVAQTVEVIFKPDKTTYQSEMPEELEEVIATDPGAKLAFDSLTPGAKRSFIYWVKQVKSTEKRIERALKIADAFRNGITSVQKMLR